MGVLVERCRYLEQSGCASICINSCKVPTQVCAEHYFACMALSLEYQLDCLVLALLPCFHSQHKPGMDMGSVSHMWAYSPQQEWIFRKLQCTNSWPRHQ
jgi:hypothetical protein